MLEQQSLTRSPKKLLKEEKKVGRPRFQLTLLLLATDLWVVRQVLALKSGTRSKRLMRIMYLGSSPICTIYFLPRSRLIWGWGDEEEAHTPWEGCSYIKHWVVSLLVLSLVFLSPPPTSK